MRKPYTVSELIEQLENLPQDINVVLTTDKEEGYVRTMIVEQHISTVGREKVVLITACFKPELYSEFPKYLTTITFLEYIGPDLTHHITNFLDNTNPRLLDIILINPERFSAYNPELSERFNKVQQELINNYK